MSAAPVLIVRVDADGRMGTGHVMRCLALAEAWAADGGAVVFLSRCESESLRRRIADAGHRFVEVSRAYPEPGDLARTLEFAQSCPGAPVVVDGYHFNEEYHRGLKTGGLRVMVVDDYAPLKQYHADWILNQNLGAENIAYPCVEDTLLLLGTKYVLLRGEFTSRLGEGRGSDAGRDSSHPVRMTNDVSLNTNNVILSEAKDLSTRHVLVTLGGADPDNVTTRVIEALARLDRDALEVRVVVGGGCVHYEAVGKAVANAGPRFHLLRDVARMSDWMAWADLAVTAGGTTCWELAFMGVPMVVLILADNQVHVAQGLAGAGAAVSAGWARDMAPARLAAAVSTLLKDPDRRRVMGERGRTLVDGRGAERVVAALRRGLA